MGLSNLMLQLRMCVTKHHVMVLWAQKYTLRNVFGILKGSVTIPKEFCGNKQNLASGMSPRANLQRATQTTKQRDEIGRQKYPAGFNVSSRPMKQYKQSQRDSPYRRSRLLVEHTGERELDPTGN